MGDEHSLIEWCCHLSSISIAVSFLKLLDPTWNTMHGVVSNNIDPRYIFGMKFYSNSFISTPPVLASSCLHQKKFSKRSNFSILNRKIHFSIHVSSCCWPTRRWGLGNVNFLLKMKRYFTTVHGPGLDGPCTSCWYRRLCGRKSTLSVLI